MLGVCQRRWQLGLTRGGEQAQRTGQAYLLEQEGDQLSQAAQPLQVFDDQHDRLSAQVDQLEAAAHKQLQAGLQAERIHLRQGVDIRAAGSQHQ
jgi:hypothetical protein